MADLFQYLEDTPARPTVEFRVQNVLTDLDGAAGGTCTVTLTRPDGTAGPGSGTVTHVSTGVYEITINAPADPYWYNVEWAGTIGSKTVKIHTRVEWIGDFLFNVADLRAMKVAGGTPFSSTATPLFTDAQIHEVRAAILDEFEEILGFSPVPRFRREVLNGNSRTCLGLPGLKAHRILSVTVNGVAQTASSYQVTDANEIEAVSNYSYGTPFTGGRRNVVVEWVHGWERVKGRGSHIAMIWAGADLNPSGFSSASTISMPDGSTYTYEPSETGRGGFRRPSGIKEADRWFNLHAAGSAAIA